MTIWFDPHHTFLVLRTRWAWLPAYAATAIALLAVQLLLAQRLAALARETIMAMGADPGVMQMATWAVRINMTVGPFVQPLVRAFLIALIVSLAAACLDSLAVKLASGLDLFFLWSLVLLAVGFVTIHKCPRRIGYLVGGTVLVALTSVSLLPF